MVSSELRENWARRTIERYEVPGYEVCSREQPICVETVDNVDGEGDDADGDGCEENEEIEGLWFCELCSLIPSQVSDLAEVNLLDSRRKSRR